MNTDEPFFTHTVAILGLGLMGGSLALALRGHCEKLLAVENDPATIELARNLQVVDDISNDPLQILPQADMIILAAPVNTIIATIRALPDLHPGSPVVLDLGSTKTLICEAYNHLPARFDPIGGHPMCGKETSGLAHAEAGLFVGAPFALTSLSRTSQAARNMVEQLVHHVGAHPLWLDPETHDRWTAASSHFPYLVSAALSLATPPEVAPLAGPGLHSTTRLAGSSPRMMRDILATNRENVLHALRGFRREMEALEVSLTRNDFQDLEERLARAARNRANIIPQ